MERLKQLWNRFVSGFETGAWNIGLFVVGLADSQDFLSLKAYLPEKLGVVFVSVGLIGLVLRYFVKIGWIREFKTETDSALAS